jgi:protease I
MSEKVLIATGEFGESLEVYYAFYRLREEGLRPVIAAPKKKLLQLVIHDFEPGYDSYTEKLGYRAAAEVAFKEVDPDDYAGLIIPGGRAPEEIRSDHELLHIVRHFLAKDKPIGALCHGVMVLYTAGSLENVDVTCYAGIRPDVEMAGAIYHDKEVVVDENIVTSRGWGDLAAFMKAFLEVLRGR